ncbi:hypothetical protein [Lysobacter terrae]
MLRSLWILACLAAGVPIAATQAAEQVWRGTVGTAAVVVELDPQAEPASGRYFYTRYLRDIRLENAESGKALRLHEATAGEAKTAEWALDTSTAGELRGEWIGADGHRLPIRLTRFDAAKERDPEREKLLHDSPYEYLRSAKLRLDPGGVETVGNYRLQWFEEPHTQVSLFKVESGYPDAVRQRINRVLRERHWQQISDAMGCVAESNGDYEATTTLRRIDATILSVSVFASYYCGGAHPDYGDSPINIDPRTGRELVLEDVLWLGKGTPPRFNGPTEDAFFKYRSETLAPWLASMMAKRHPNEVEEADCDYTDPEVWKYVSWYVRDDGLYLGPSFARAARNCEYPEWSVLPWKDIARHPGRVRVGPAAPKPSGK